MSLDASCGFYSEVELIRDKPIETNQRAYASDISNGMSTVWQENYGTR
jgi:hypothetical protein